MDSDAEDHVIDVGITLTDAKSWLRESELMIATCSVAGEFGEKVAFPLPHRGQEPFEYPSEEAVEVIPNVEQ